MPHDEHDDYDDEPWRKPTPPEQLARFPALALGWCAWLFVVAGLFGVALAAIFFLDMMGYTTERAARDAGGNLVLTAGFVGACVLWAVSLVRGARALRTLRGYKFALLAAGMAILPVACPYVAPITLPIGIWAVVVLLQWTVRARFVENDRDTLPHGP